MTDGDAPPRAANRAHHAAVSTRAYRQCAPTKHMSTVARESHSRHHLLGQLCFRLSTKSIPDGCSRSKR